ncbi:MAG: prephenate dehydratase [Alphaproteobacteria bacterium]|nr:prephenate dehydratase [Alphaproteobacteria bacterium]
MTDRVAFQGVFGAYSHLTCMELYPNADYLPCQTFDAAFSAVQQGTADFAVIPIENSNAGRVTDVHFLLSKTPLHIIGEHFLRIEHQLIGLPNAEFNDIKKAISHPQALSQCSTFLQTNKITPKAQSDTALSCKILTEIQDKSVAAIASSAAAKIYNLKILASNIENAANNTTRFLVMSREKITPVNDGKKFITSLIFKAKNIPAALYKSLGGFATNNINVTKLESYLLNGKFVSAQFYMEVEAHPETAAFKNAMSELKFFSEDNLILGTYPAHDYRYR